MKLTNTTGHALTFAFGGQRYKVATGGTVEMPDALVPAALSRGLPLAVVEAPVEAVAEPVVEAVASPEVSPVANAEPVKRKRGRPKKTVDAEIVIEEDAPLDVLS